MESHEIAGGDFDADTVPYFDFSQSEEIQVRHGCVLIPIFVAVWWYYTRRAARRAFRLITSGDGCFSRPEATEGVSVSSSRSFDAACNEEEGAYQVHAVQNHDKFNSWDDVIEHNTRQSSSMRLVRWITAKGKLSKKRRIRAVSKAVMNRASAAPPADHTIPMYNANQDLDIGPDCDGLLTLDDALSASSCGWQCIEDTEAGATIEHACARRSLADDVSHQSGVAV